MKRTQLKDALRNIRRQKVSYISIVVIAAMAVTAYLGISFSAEAMRRSGNAFYDETNFRDIEIMSTLLFSSDDLETIRGTEGVSDVEGVCQTSGKLVNGGLHEDVYVVSLTERINLPVVVSGRLPETAVECALEQSVAETLGFAVGDTVSVRDDTGGTPSYLLGTDYTVTGIVLHPDHMAQPAQVPGNRYILVTSAAFDQQALDGGCLKAEITVGGAAGLNRFSDEYLAAIADTQARLEALGEERAVLRYEEVHGKYQSELDDNQTRLDDAKTELDGARAELDENREKLAEGERELADAERQMADSERQLADARTELADGRRELDDGQAQLDSSYDQLMSAWRQLEEARLELEDGGRQLAEGEQALADARAGLVSGYAQLEDAKATVRNALYSALYDAVGGYADTLPWSGGAYDADVDSQSTTAAYFSITDGLTVDLNRSMGDNIFSLVASLGLSEEELRAAYEEVTGLYLELSDGQSVLDAVVAYATERYAAYDAQYGQLAAAAARQWDDGHAQYISGRDQLAQRRGEYEDGVRQYETALAQYESGLAQYDAGRSRLDAGWAEYEDGLRQYEEGTAALEDGRRQYEEGAAELEDGRAQLDDGEAQYADGLAEYEDGAAQLDEARQELASLDECRWIVFNVRGNGGYMHLALSAENTANLSMTFSLLFVLVGALVIYATVGRIVDEQRRLIGATKALGFFTREIMAKYLLFGVSATVLGALLGVAMGYFGVQTIVLGSYGRAYVFGDLTPALQVPASLLVIAAAAALAVLAMWLSCAQLMRSTAIQLMQEKAPSGKNRVSRRNGRGRSLYARLILRNMRSDLPRVAVTIVSVAGCCALLVIGFTMRSAVAGAIERQYGRIVRFDDRLTFNPHISDTAETELEAVLKDAGVTWLEVGAAYQTFRAGEELELAELICGDLDALGDYYAFRDWRTGAPLPAGAEGVFIQKRTAESSGVEAGDTIVLYDAMMKPYTARIAGVFDNYVGRSMLMTEEYYETLFGEPAVQNTYLLFLNGADADALADKLAAVDGFESFETAEQEKAMYEGYVVILNGIVVILTAVAGLMAYFILLNIANMYINQKKRELTVMRVNGFSVREVKRYVSRETIVTTSLGVALGLTGGSFIAYKVIRFIEMPHIQFVRDISWSAWLLSAAITVGFTLGINAIALRRVKHLKLTDVA